MTLITLQCSKGHTSKSRKTRVMVLEFGMLSRYMVLYISVKFHENISNSFQVD